MRVDREGIAQPRNFIREREVHIAIGVVDELDDFGGLRSRHLDDGIGQPPENGCGTVADGRIICADNLRQFPEFL